MKINFSKTVTLLLAVFFIMAASVSCDSKLDRRELTITKADGTEITVKAEMAVKNEDRMHGFMGRKNIPEGTGMLFVFDYDQILSFWMKNTPTPLSIAYINSSGKIRDIMDMQPFTYDSHVSTGYVRYALEVPQGWFEKNGIQTGDTLKIDFQ